MFPKRNTKQITWAGRAYILPALLFYTVFMAFPLLNSIYLSFFSKIDSQFVYVGLKNYIRIFSDDTIANRYWGAFLHTWIFFSIHMLVQNSLGILFANLLSSKHIKGSSVYRTILFLPATLSIVVTGYLWKLILNPQWGAFHFLFQYLGFNQYTAWLGNPHTALIAVSLVSSWQWVGIPTMIFLAGLNNIPDELFESAHIAGASGWQVFRYIKVPLLKPVIAIVFILTFVNNFNAFDIVFAMQTANGAPQYATDILGTFFYRIGIAGQHPVGIPDRGLGGAVATITCIVLLIGVGVILHLFNKEKKHLA